MESHECRLSDAGLLESFATLAWAKNNNVDMIQTVLTARVGYELYQRLSGQREVDALHQKTIEAIAKYVKDHPNARKEDLQKEIAKQIVIFENDLKKL